MPAGEPFVIRFTNLEAVVHNVSVYAGDTTIFEGGPRSPAQMPRSITSSRRSSRASTLYICDFHPIPQMTGTLTAR